MTDIPPSDPVLLAALTLIIAAAVHYQRGLTWTEYRSIHRLKVRYFPLLQRMDPFGFSKFVHEKRGHTDPEFVTSRNQSVRAVWKQLVAEGFSPHLICSIKKRTAGEETQYSAAHAVWLHEDGSQTEAYLFRFTQGRTDVYAHHETSVVDPDGHLTDPQHDGDPRGVVRDALGIESAPPTETHDP